MLDRRNDNVYMYISIISVYCIQYVLAYVIYNGTIFNILSCNTEQSLDYVDALSKKKKKMLRTVHCMYDNIFLIEASI